MNGLTLGIGLSGKEKIDDSGFDALLQAEQGAANVRLSEQKAKKKEKADLEKGIRENTAFDPTKFSQSRLAVEDRDDQISTMADIMGAIAEGKNGAVYADSKIKELHRRSLARQNTDANLTKSFNEAMSNPDAYTEFNTPIRVMSKDYNTIQELYNDSNVPLEEMAKYLNGSEYVFGKDEIIGDSFNYNPRPSANPLDAIAGIDKALFDQLYVGKADRGTRGIYEETGRKLSPEQVEIEIGRIIGSATSDKWLEDAYLKEVRKTNPKATRLDVLNDPEGQAKFINNYIDTTLRPEIEGSVDGAKYQRIGDPSPKKATVDKTGYTSSDRPQVMENHHGSGKSAFFYEFLPNSGGKRNTDITVFPKGTTRVSKSGNIAEEDEDTIDKDGGYRKQRQEQAAPWGVAYVDGKIKFDYTGDKDGEYYAVPNTQGSFEAFVNDTKPKNTSPAEHAKVILAKIAELSNGDMSVASLVKDYHANLYPDEHKSGANKTGGGQEGDVDEFGLPKID